MNPQEQQPNPQQFDTPAAPQPLSSPQQVIGSNMMPQNIVTAKKIFQKMDIWRNWLFRALNWHNRWTHFFPDE